MSTKSQTTKFFGIKHPTSFFEKRKFVNNLTLEDSQENIISDNVLVSEELKIFFFKMQHKLYILMKNHIL